MVATVDVLTTVDMMAMVSDWRFIIAALTNDIQTLTISHQAQYAFMKVLFLFDFLQLIN